MELPPVTPTLHVSQLPSKQANEINDENTICHMGLVGDRIANHRHNGCSITKNGHTVVKAMMYIVVLRQQSKLLKIQALLSLCKSISGPISSHGLFSHSNAKL